MCFLDNSWSVRISPVGGEPAPPACRWDPVVFFDQFWICRGREEGRGCERCLLSVILLLESHQMWLKNIGQSDRATAAPSSAGRSPAGPSPLLLWSQDQEAAYTSVRPGGRLGLTS